MFNALRALRLLQRALVVALVLAIVAPTLSRAVSAPAPQDALALDAVCRSAGPSNADASVAPASANLAHLLEPCPLCLLQGQAMAPAARVAGPVRVAARSVLPLLGVESIVASNARAGLAGLPRAPPRLG